MRSRSADRARPHPFPPGSRSSANHPCLIPSPDRDEAPRLNPALRAYPPGIPIASCVAARRLDVWHQHATPPDSRVGTDRQSRPWPLPCRDDATTVSPPGSRVEACSSKQTQRVPSPRAELRLSSGLSNVPNQFTSLRVRNSLSVLLREWSNVRLCGLKYHIGR